MRGTQHVHKVRLVEIRADETNLYLHLEGENGDYFDLHLYGPGNKSLPEVTMDQDLEVDLLHEQR